MEHGLKPLDTCFHLEKKKNKKKNCNDSMVFISVVYKGFSLIQVYLFFFLFLINTLLKEVNLTANKLKVPLIIYQILMINKGNLESHKNYGNSCKKITNIFLEQILNNSNN